MVGGAGVEFSASSEGRQPGPIPRTLKAIAASKRVKTQNRVPGLVRMNRF